MLVNHFRGKTLAQVSPLAVEKFKSERRKSTVEFKEKAGRTRGPASVNRELELLSRIFALAVKVAVGTGMRRGDQFGSRKSRVDFQRGGVRVPNSKTGGEYPVPMTHEVRVIMLEAVRGDPASESVFVNPDTGRPYTDLKKGFAATRTASEDCPSRPGASRPRRPDPRPP